MRRAVQVLLVPFWVAGFTVGAVVVVMLAVWHATQAGYKDITTWVAGSSDG